MKPLPPESERDLKSHPMRSKLLSLHLVLTILSTHMPLFTSPTALIHSSSNDSEPTLFVQAIKQYLCLSLSRNAVSAVLQVFEASVEIFWLVLNGMRRSLKREIEVLFSEIFIPILEMRTSTPAQKLVLVSSMLQRLCQDPQALVEIYLNYDCDASAVENVYERLVGVVSKQAGAHTTAAPARSNSAAGTAGDIHSPTRPGSARTGQHAIPPSLTTSALSDPTASGDAAGVPGQERKLQVQSLECLVFVLRSLNAWKDAAQAKTTGGGVTNATLTPSGSGQAQSDAPLSAGLGNGLSLSTEGSSRSSFTGEDGRAENATARTSNVSGGSVDLRPGGSVSGPGSITPIERDGPMEDDPNRFESERIRKMTMAEGLRLFNTKQKKVSLCSY